MRTKLLTKLAAFAFLFNSAQAGGDSWMTDYEAAKAKAVKENKDLLIEFTGSDWCPPCMALYKNVFSKDEFVKAASEDFILVALDYPRKKELPEGLKAQNAMLSGKYGISAFPTVLLCDSKGMPYASSGYQKCGPEEYATILKGKLTNKKKRDDALAAAGKLEGKAKAKALWEAIADLGPSVSAGYESVLKDILAADPSDEGGKIAIILLDAEFGSLKADGSENAAAFKKVDALIAKLGLEGNAKQEMLADKKLNVLYGQKNFKAMKTIVDDLIAIDPDSRTGKSLAGFKPRLEKMIEDQKNKETAPVKP